MKELRLTLRSSANAVLAAWQETFGPARGDGRYQLDVNGADVLLVVGSGSSARTVKGRLSALGLLCGRFWAAAALDAEGYRLCPAWIPTLLDTPEGLGAVLSRQDVRYALERAADAFDEAGEFDEASACRVRAERAVAPLDGKSLEKTLAGLKQGDPAARLRAVRSVEAAFEALTGPIALANFGPFRSALRVLLADPYPALQERALALTEAWARRLHGDCAYREALPLLDTLIEGGVALGDMLRMRHECRLVTGDGPGARNDLARVAHARTAAADVDPRPLSSLEPWRVQVLSRVAHAHLLWADGRDPCNGRPVASKPAPLAALRHASAARDMVEEALAIVAKMPEAGEPEALRAVRDEAVRKAEKLRPSARSRGPASP